MYARKLEPLESNEPIVLHRKILEDSKLRPQWNDLALQMEGREVFYTYQCAGDAVCGSSFPYAV
jgi:hypothetical protein